MRPTTAASASARRRAAGAVLDRGSPSGCWCAAPMRRCCRAKACSGLGSAEAVCHPRRMTDSPLFDRLQRLFDEGHGVELPDLRSDAHFAPPEIRPAAVLIAVTDRAE